MKDLEGLRVTIIGLAREGVALAAYLARHGAQVTGSDLKDAEALRDHLARLAGWPVRLVLGGHPPELLDADVVFVSPGVPGNIPLLQEARRRGIPLTTETRLVCQRAPGLVVGITGSSGKTTTTALVGEMLAASGFRTWVGGNIGRPLVGRLDEMAPDDRVVMELSSFQLEYFAPVETARGRGALLEMVCQPEGVSPPVAAILNITPNHLDRHPSMEAYTEAKRHIYRHQGVGGVVVLSAENPTTRRMAQELQHEGRHVVCFGAEAVLEGPGAYLRPDGWIVVRMEQGDEVSICRAAEMRLLGPHNLRNVLAACAIASQAGAHAEAMAGVIRTFPGVPHRLELVRQRGGVRWYNDSIATTPERTSAALRSFEEPIVLLAGGRDKHLPWEEMATLCWQKVRALILFGEAGPLIEGVVRRVAAAHPRLAVREMDIVRCTTLEEAVQEAARLARPGDVVLLSPGGTSFDAYRDFEERGAHFRALVRALDEA